MRLTQRSPCKTSWKYKSNKPEEKQKAIIKEALIKATCANGEQILRPPRRKNRRNTLCISRFLERRRAQNLPPDVRGDLFSVSLRGPKLKIIAALRNAPGGEGQSYIQCAEFLMDFQLPVEGGGT